MKSVNGSIVRIPWGRNSSGGIQPEDVADYRSVGEFDPPGRAPLPEDLEPPEPIAKKDEDGEERPQQG